jgi:phosphoribosyl-dephospho-CoA transferase
MVGDYADGVPAALPLPPSYGKKRLAFSFPSAAAAVVESPVLLRDAVPTAPTSWHPTLDALLELGDVSGITPRVFGALLWQHATGLPYLTARSDLDLLWPVSDERAAVSVVEGLARLEADGPVHLDGELELPDGMAVNWREVAQSFADPCHELLVKSMDGVELRTWTRFFRTRKSPL